MFVHKERDITTAVYGDDFTSAGRKSQLDWSRGAMEAKYELNELARMGPGPNDDKKAKILNRVIMWASAGLEYEADLRQLAKLLRDLGIDAG